MKAKEARFKFKIGTAYHVGCVACAVAIVLKFAVLAGYGQTNNYLYSRSKQNITLNPGLYTITAYGAQGGGCYQSAGGLGAKMTGEFLFKAPTTLILLVGGAGRDGFGQFGAGGGGGGGSFVINGNTPLVVAGGGGGGGAAGSQAGNTNTSGGYGGYGGGVGGIDGGVGESSGGTGGGGGFSGGGDGNSGRSFLSGGVGGGNGGYGGGGGGNYWQRGGGGGGFSGGGAGGFGPYNPHFGYGGGGGGSILDASAIRILAGVSGAASPNGSPNGEIIITAITLPPPTIICPEPLTLECTDGSAVGTLKASVIDTNGLPVQVIWTVDGVASQTNNIPSGGRLTESNLTFTASFSEGEHLVVIAASNGSTAPASCSTMVTTQDTLSPVVLANSATPDLLWPPNHRMVSVKLNVAAVDECDPSPTAQITRVTCNEPPGRLAPDWTITGPLSVDLRAGRMGNHRRIYTIYVDVSDASGNKTTTTTTVTVPESMGMR